MKKYLLMLVPLFALTLAACDEDEEDDGLDLSDTELDESAAAEVKSAYSLINAIRANPSAYSDKMGVDLSDVEARSALNWNATLAKVAQTKAQDMADNNYFSHTDQDGYGMNYYINKAGYTLEESWYATKSLNYFENIAAGNSTAEATIKQFIYDSGNSNDNAGHRSSLLGISDWNASCYDIGIGFAYNANSTYRYYWSIVIAKHTY